VFSVPYANCTLRNTIFYCHTVTIFKHVTLVFFNNNDNKHLTETVTSKYLLWCNTTGISYLLIVGYMLLIPPRLIFMHFIMHVIDKKCIKISLKSLRHVLSFRSLWNLKTSIIVKLNGMSMYNVVHCIDWEYWKLYNITQRSCHHMFVIFNMKQFCMFVGMSIIHDHNKCHTAPWNYSVLIIITTSEKIIYRIHMHTVFYILYTQIHT
jgi:hypothetical protein